MTFDQWMKKENPAYRKGDDTAAIRKLRKCWDAAVSSAEPLTTKEIRKLDEQEFNNWVTAFRIKTSWTVAFARAIERAHGIGVKVKK